MLTYSPKFRTLLAALVIPLLSVGLTFALRFVLASAIGDAPFLLLLAAVTLSAYVGGLAGGLVATVLSVVITAANMQPALSFAIRDPHDRLQILLFTTEAIVISMLCAALRAARLRAEGSAQEARALQEQVSDAADREQTRIGQDLHDDLGQYLTAVALAGGLLARRVERANTGLGEEAQKLVHMINDAVNRTRQLARGLAPMTIEPDSLVLLLRELQERAAEISELEVRFEVDGSPPSLTRETVLHLYRIAQEAVGNATKHSGAKHIDIVLRNSEAGVSLMVRDDGRWSSPREGANGMGLRVMQFRARTIGATLEFTHASAAEGTRVRCVLPPSSSRKSAGDGAMPTL